jgi:hypothetical protein
MSVAAPEHGLAIPAGDPQALRAAAGRLIGAAAAMDGVAAALAKLAGELQAAQVQARRAQATADTAPGFIDTAIQGLALLDTSVRRTRWPARGCSAPWTTPPRS